jgi:ribosomal protein S18 acetylase RimI-like enzyme
LGPALDIQIRAARRGDAGSLGLLLHEAGGPISASIFGLGDPSMSIGHLCKLAARGGNMFSWDITTVAERSGQVIGICSSLPGRQTSARAMPTYWAMFRVYGLIDFFLIMRRLTVLRRGSPEMSANHYQVLNLAVAAEFRGRGVGTALLEAAHDDARAAGFSRCSLTVLSENRFARRMYERVGYRASVVRRDDDLLRLSGASGSTLMTIHT